MLGVLWSAVLLACSLYLSRFDQLPEEYLVLWPVGVELMGAVFTLVILLPCFAVRVF